MALPASGAISIGQYNRELLYRLTGYDAGSQSSLITNPYNFYLERSMNNSYFRYVNGATTAGSQISMSSGYGKSGLPRHIRLSGTTVNNGTFTSHFVVDNSQNSIYAVGFNENQGSANFNQRFSAVITKINTTNAGTTAVWSKKFLATSPSGVNNGSFAPSCALSGDNATLYVLVAQYYGYAMSLLVIRCSDGVLLDQREIRNTSAQPEVPTHIAIGPDGGIYITGSQYVSGGQGSEGMIWKLNSDYTTNFLFGFGANSRTQRLYTTAFNNAGTRMVSVGYAQYPVSIANPLIILLDLNGAVIWSRCLSWPDGVISQGVLNSVTFDSAGNIYACGFASRSASGQQVGFIIKINPDTAQIMWAKTLAIGGTTVNNEFSGITYNSTEQVLYISGYCISNNGSNAQALGLAVFDLDGNLLRLRTLEIYRASDNGDVQLNNSSSYYTRIFWRSAFDSQGNIITAFPMNHTGSTTSLIRASTVFHRDKLYSTTPNPTNPGLREIVGDTGTADAGGAYEYIPAYDNVTYYTQARQSYLSWSSYLTYALTNLADSTNIASGALGDTSGYIFTSGWVNDNSYPGTLTDFSAYVAGSYWG